MSLLLMRGGVGLPRNGLIALYDPYRDAYGLDATARAALQTGVDYSGRGNTLTYGATTGASTDDPTNTGTAWVHAASFLISPVVPTLMLNGSFTALWVGTNSATTGKIISIADVTSIDKYSSVQRNGASVIISTRNPSGTVNSTGINCAFTGTVALILRSDGTNLTLKNLSTGGTVSVALSANAIAGRIGIGCLARSAIADVVDSLTTDLVAVWTRSLAVNEYTRAYRYIKSLLAQRGVTLA